MEFWPLMNFCAIDARAYLKNILKALTEIGGDVSTNAN